MLHDPQLRNPDALSDALCPPDGCPVATDGRPCGAAFVEVGEVWLEGPLVTRFSYHGNWLADANLEVKGVRLICSVGHEHDHVASFRTRYSYLDWSAEDIEEELKPWSIE